MDPADLSEHAIRRNFSLISLSLQDLLLKVPPDLELRWDMELSEAAGRNMAERERSVAGLTRIKAWSPWHNPSRKAADRTTKGKRPWPQKRSLRGVIYTCAYEIKSKQIKQNKIKLKLE